MRAILFRNLICLFLLVAGNVYAQAQMNTSARFGDYTVHYVAVNSTFIDPDIAQRYGLSRSQRRAFLNISVLKNLPAGGTMAVTAAVEGTRNNLLQQSSTIEFVEIVEGNAVYYLGEFDFTNAEPVRFELSIQPEHSGPEYSLEWDTRLYTN